jgi:acetate kinase
MKSGKPCVLAINGGSSSIKFALYEVDGRLTQSLSGELENIGAKNTALNYKNANEKYSIKAEAADHNEAANFLIDWLEKQDGFASVSAVGHRIVHGMQHTAPEKITPALLADLNKISSYDPEHLPEEIKLIEVFSKRYASLAQVACFDTSFHASMPKVAKLLSIPRQYFDKGIRRYGFHGLSYSYLMEELDKVTGSKTSKEKIILAHLGNGASLAAIKDGKSIDTSMGFTPTAGIPMGTRTGDLDPGVAWYLMQEEKMSAKKFNHLINHESGLLGISETNSDMRELLKLQSTDNRAVEAVELFCYQTKKWIGSYAAVLGGLDTLVFSGGIGEHAPEVRERICSDLGFLGIELDEKRNANNEAIISNGHCRVTVRVIKTNEELMIARLVCRVLNFQLTEVDACYF